MADQADEISVNPQIMLLEQVLAEMAAGRLRVPKFQRPFVWRPEQMLNLFDSIERGYPIGSLLVWDTDLAIPSLDRVANIDIPPPPASGLVGFVLDGHQRLSTLLGALRSHAEAIEGVPRQQRDWMWDIYRVLGDSADRSDGFRHWTRSGTPPAEYLPMRSVLRTMDFLAYSRRLADAVMEDRATLAELIDEAEQLAHRIKSYQIAVVRLKGGELQHAVEVFSRLNSSGQSMTPDQMVSALTYRADGETLADRIDTIREDLGAIGYGDIDSITIFRSILAVAGEKDVQNARWDRLANRVQGKLTDAVENTDRAIRLAVGFLRDQCRVPLARLIPYQLQVLLLTAAFHENPDLTPAQLEELERWFWGTSWSGFFASANTSQVRSSLSLMREFAAGKRKSPWTPLPARPFPERFDFRSARVRSYILWELRRFEGRLDLAGNRIAGVDLLARSHTTTYQHVVLGAPSSSHPANRVILPTPAGVSPKSALLRLYPDASPLADASLSGEPGFLDDDPTLADTTLASHGVPWEALYRLARGDGEGFIRVRADFLAAEERSFIVSMGIEPADETIGEADIDTE